MKKNEVLCLCCLTNPINMAGQNGKYCVHCSKYINKKLNYFRTPTGKVREYPAGLHRVYVHHDTIEKVLQIGTKRWLAESPNNKKNFCFYLKQIIEELK